MCAIASSSRWRSSSEADPSLAPWGKGGEPSLRPIYKMSSHRHRSLREGRDVGGSLFREALWSERRWLALALARDDDSLLLLEGYWS